MFTKKTSSRLKRVSTLSLILAILAPALVSATVILTYQYGLSIGSATPEFYVGEGENYAVANDLGLISASTATAGGTTYIPSGTININLADGAYEEILLNVLEIVNASSGLKGNVYVYLNDSSVPSGLTIYASTSPLVYTGTGVTSSKTVYELTSTTNPNSVKILLTAGTTVYIGFELSSSVSSSASSTLSVQFSIQ